MSQSHMCLLKKDSKPGTVWDTALAVADYGDIVAARVAEDHMRQSRIRHLEWMHKHHSCFRHTRDPNATSDYSLHSTDSIVDAAADGVSSVVDVLGNDL